MFKIACAREIARCIGVAVVACAVPAAAAQLGGCPVFPADNIWNTAVDTLPVDARSSAYIQTQGGSGAPLHPDFGTVYNGAPNGIPYVIVPATQPPVPIVLDPYGSEGDPGPYPIPPNAPIEGGPASNGDRHVLVLQQGTCKLYELFRAFPRVGGGWQGFGAVFDLKTNAPLRPDTFTSADAAGLPIMPGLVKYDDVQAALRGSGIVPHAFRFTVPYTRRAYVWPARHFASASTDLNRPPLGQRFRLKASVNIDFYPGTATAVSPTNKVILRTLKKYGMFLADNGGSFFLSGAPDPRWNDDDLHLLVYYRATDFEAVDSASLMLDRNSGQARQPAVSGGARLSVTPTAAASGTSVTAAWSGIAAPTPTDWIGLYRPGAAPTAQLEWMYLSCSKIAGSVSPNNSCAFPLPRTLAAGSYELRLHAANGYTLLARSGPISVSATTPAGPTLSAPSSAVRGARVTVSWSGIASPSATDWIGLHRVGSASTSFIDWLYVNCAKTGSAARASGGCIFSVPSTLAVGTYEFRLHRANTYTVLATSVPVSIR